MMKRNPIYLFVTGIVFIVLLSSCGQGNKFASSFGKRKYTNGYFVDRVSSVKEVIPSHTSYESRSLSPTAVPSIPAKSNPVEIATSSPSVQTFNRAKMQHVANNSNENKLVQSVVLSDTTAKPKKSSWDRHGDDLNSWAIFGCGASVAGAILAIIAHSFTPLALVFSGIATILCIISFFKHKVYYNWLGALGLFILIAIVTLIFV